MALKCKLRPFQASANAVGNVVNLNKFRKRKAKAARDRQAETNRRLHGRTAAERARDELQKQQLTSKVDGAQMERSAEEDKEET